MNADLMTSRYSFSLDFLSFFLMEVLLFVLLLDGLGMASKHVVCLLDGIVL